MTSSSPMNVLFQHFSSDMCNLIISYILTPSEIIIHKLFKVFMNLDLGNYKPTELRKCSSTIYKFLEFMEFDCTSDNTYQILNLNAAFKKYLKYLKNGTKRRRSHQIIEGEISPLTRRSKILIWNARSLSAAKMLASIAYLIAILLFAA